MLKRRKWLLVVGLVGSIAGAYWWLLMESGAPEGTFPVELSEVRRLAESVPGEKPSAIRFEHVAAFEFPSIAVMAGESWKFTKMPVYAYQLVSSTHRVIADTAMDAQTSQNGGAVFFDAEAAERVSKGMTQASSIVVTHEHYDHLAGLAMHPDVQALLKKTVLTVEQLNEPSRMLPLVFPKAALDGYRGHRLAPLHALAPGVVLIRSPGHSPGAQMIFVKKADGSEVLLIGDVSWQMRNIEAVRERPRLVTYFFLKEDRRAILQQLAWLKGLQSSEPQLIIVPGHDGDLVDGLARRGILKKGFEIQ